MTPPPDFNRVARVYRWLEYLSFGKLLERCRFHFIPSLLSRKNALVIGDGDGRFISKLLIENPQLSADAIDSSFVMLQLLLQRTGDRQRLRTHHMSALDYQSSRHVDLVVTHFVFDCFNDREVRQLIASISPSVTSDGLWLVSEFRIPRGRGRVVAGCLVSLLYFAFRMTTGLRVKTLPKYEDLLNEAAFVLVAEKRFLFGILTTQLWQKSIENY